jgi:hypothetical protein
MAVTYYGYKSNSYGASAVASDPYFSYQSVSYSGTQANQTVVSIDACSISNANTNGSSSSGYRMNIEAQIGGTWYTLGYITVGGQVATHQTFSGFTPTADAALRSLMGKTPPEALRGKVVEGYFHLNAGSVLQLSASTQMDYTACTEPTELSVSAAQSEGNVTLSWSGAQAGANNAITGYEVQYQESPDNSSWDAWNGLATVSTTAGYGTLSVAPSSTRGNYRRFQVRTLGAVGGSYCSPWKISTNSVRRYLLSTLSLDKQTLNAGETITATIGIGQNSYTHKLTFVFGNLSQVQELAAGVSSYAFTVPTAWLSQIPASFSGVATCTLETHSDSTVIDTRSKTFTIACPDSVVPVIGSVSLSPVSGSVPPAWNLYVKGRSSVLVQASSIAAGTGASITGYQITGGGYDSKRVSYTTGVAHTTDPIDRSGNVDFTLTVYDSRGRSAQMTVAANFVEYNPPLIEGFKAYRVNSERTVDPNGTNIKCEVSYSFNLLSTKNTATIAISVNGTVVKGPDALSQGSGTVTIYLPEPPAQAGPYATNKSYAVNAVVEDALAQRAVGSVTVDTSARKLNIGSGKDGGVALGKISEHAKTLELASDWKLRAYGVQIGVPSNPNLLIGGNFLTNPWQRGNNFAPPNGTYVYTADRWKFSFGTVSRDTGTYPGLYLYCNAPWSQIMSPLEHPELYSGKQVTLSVKVIASTKASMIFIALIRNGTYSYPISTVMQAGFNGIASVTGTLPTILPTDNLAVYFGSQSDYPAEYRVEWIKMEYGAIATPEYPRSLGEELALCHRFYWQTTSYIRSSSIPIANQTTGILAYTVFFPSSMRVTPTITLSDTVGNVGYVNRTIPTVSTVDGQPFTTAITPDYIYVRSDGTAAATELRFNLKADAEIY